MSLKTILITIEESAISLVKSLGATVEDFVVTEVQKLVAEAKNTDLGTRAANLIELLTTESISGPEKMVKLVGELTSDAEAFLAGGGVNGAIIGVEHFVREFAQSAFNDFVAATKDF